MPERFPQPQADNILNAINADVEASQAETLKVKPEAPTLKTEKTWKASEAVMQDVVEQSAAAAQTLATGKTWEKDSALLDKISKETEAGAQAKEAIIGKSQEALEALSAGVDRRAEMSPAAKAMGAAAESMGTQAGQYEQKKAETAELLGKINVGLADNATSEQMFAAENAIRRLAQGQIEGSLSVVVAKVKFDEFLKQHLTPEQVEEIEGYDFVKKMFSEDQEKTLRRAS